MLLPRRLRQGHHAQDFHFTSDTPLRPGVGQPFIQQLERLACLPLCHQQPGGHHCLPLLIGSQGLRPALHRWQIAHRQRPPGLPGAHLLQQRRSGLGCQRSQQVLRLVHLSLRLLEARQHQRPMRQQILLRVLPADGYPLRHVRLGRLQIILLQGQHTQPKPRPPAADQHPRPVHRRIFAPGQHLPVELPRLAQRGLLVGNFAQQQGRIKHLEDIAGRLRAGSPPAQGLTRRIQPAGRQLLSTHQHQADAAPLHFVLGQQLQRPPCQEE